MKVQRGSYCRFGSEFRIKNNGDIIIDNPELELAGDDRAADAILMYRFNAQAGVHAMDSAIPLAHQPRRAGYRKKVRRACT